MALSAKNILVGAARVFVSYGAGANRPNPTMSAVFPWSVAQGTNSELTGSTVKNSVTNYLLTTASSYWREFGFTSNGVELSYEPGYSDVVVDQLLDAARLFQQSLKIMIKTELDEGTFENINIVWGQQEQVPNADGSAFVSALSDTAAGAPLSDANLVAYGTSPTASAVAATQLNMNVGALGAAPVERSLVFIGQAAGQTGLANATYPVANTSGSVGTVSAYGDASAIARKERIYYARRAVQTESTAHSLKRDSATVFPVSFRLLPDVDRASGGTVYAAGSEYGFIVDRIYGNS